VPDLARRKCGELYQAAANRVLLRRNDGKGALPANGWLRQ